MKVAQNPLPFPAPLDRLWLNIEKVIDSFHLSNHVISASCRDKFSPSKLKADNPNYNTQLGNKHCLGGKVQTYFMFNEQGSSSLLFTPYG